MYKQVGGIYWLLPTKNENKHVRFGSCLGILIHGGLAHNIAVSRRFADLLDCRALYCVVHVVLGDILVEFVLVPTLVTLISVLVMLMTSTDIRVTRVLGSAVTWDEDELYKDIAQYDMHTKLGFSMGGF
jgi:hypothetical protein